MHAFLKLYYVHLSSKEVALCSVLKIQNRHVHSDRKCRGLGAWWTWEVTANTYEVSFRGDGNVLKLDRGDGCPILQLNQNPLNSTRQTGEFYGM